MSNKAMGAGVLGIIIFTVTLFVSQTLFNNLLLAIIFALASTFGSAIIVYVLVRMFSAKIPAPTFAETYLVTSVLGLPFLSFVFVQTFNLDLNLTVGLGFVAYIAFIFGLYKWLVGSIGRTILITLMYSLVGGILAVVLAFGLMGGILFNISKSFENHDSENENSVNPSYIDQESSVDNDLSSDQLLKTNQDDTKHESTSSLETLTTSSSAIPSTPSSTGVSSSVDVPNFKKYSGSKISFNYPVSWNIINDNANTLDVWGTSNDAPIKKYFAFDYFSRTGTRNAEDIEYSLEYEKLNNDSQSISYTVSDVNINGYDAVAVKSHKNDNYQEVKINYYIFNGAKGLILRQVCAADLRVSLSSCEAELEGVFNTYLKDSLKIL